VTEATEAPTADRIGTWTPLRRPAFRALWIASATSQLGTWMQTVGAQWFLTEREASATLIATVQTATGLPVLLLALPVGALADLLDRRRILIGSSVAACLVATVMTVLTGAGLLSPYGLLALTALLGTTQAVMMPTWQAVQPDLVPRAELPAAAALGGISINAGRALGPAIGGVLVAAGGPAWVFGLNAVSFVLEKSGISRSRLVYLRTTKGAEPSLSEAKALAPVFKMTIDQLAEELERIEGEEG